MAKQRKRVLQGLVQAKKRKLVHECICFGAIFVLNQISFDQNNQKTIIIKAFRWYQSTWMWQPNNVCRNVWLIKSSNCTPTPVRCHLCHPI